MKTLQSLVESELPVQEVLEAVLPLTVRRKPEYKGNAHVKLRVDFAMGNAWNGVATVDGREIKITGPYGTQSKVPGLIVPAGVGRGEWEWNQNTGINETESETPEPILIPAGALVHISGMPFYLEKATSVLGRRTNLAQDC